MFLILIKHVLFLTEFKCCLRSSMKFLWGNTEPFIISVIFWPKIFEMYVLKVKTCSRSKNIWSILFIISWGHDPHWQPQLGNHQPISNVLNYFFQIAFKQCVIIGNLLLFFTDQRSSLREHLLSEWWTGGQQHWSRIFLRYSDGQHCIRPEK